MGDDQASFTHAQIFGFLESLVGASNIDKYRISSIVIDPVASPTAVVGGTNILMGISGQKYVWPNVDRPIRMRFGKEVGDDGMWLVNDGAALTDAVLPGLEVTTDPFITVVVPSVVTTWETQIHVRFAFQDPT